MKEQKLHIRADGNSVLGMGHLMRCFVIAQEWERTQGPCCFLVSDDISGQIVKEHGFQAVNLDSDWKNLDREIVRLEEILKKEHVQILMMDSYYYTKGYIHMAGRFCKTVCMGEIEYGRYPADLLINYNLYMSQEKQEHALFGTAYFPLRKEFAERAIYIRKRAETVFLSTGSTDPLGIMRKMAAVLLEKGFTIEAVTGTFNEYQKELRELERENLRFHLHVNAENMAEIMESCDIAVSAAGITLYELCAMGIPTVTFSFADNQLPGAEVMQEKNIMINVGDMRSNLETRVKKTVEYVKELSENEKERKLRSERMRKLVDGKGAQRIVLELSRL